MPNWCENRAVINAPRPVIDEIRSILEDRDQDSRLLKWMRPLPPDQEENWYDWCVTNWGTKWDICDVYVVNDEEEDSIEFSFNTAWAPPTEAFLYWAQQDGCVSYSLKYYEPGMGFVGEASYDGDTYEDDCVSYNDDPARFEDLAADEWGWEPDEDPEPLTEWYTQGAREKGLME